MTSFYINDLAFSFVFIQTNIANSLTVVATVSITSPSPS